MSCIASAVSAVSALGSTRRNVPAGVSNVVTPSVVTRRYWVSSDPSGSSSVYERSAMPLIVPRRGESSPFRQAPIDPYVHPVAQLGADDVEVDRLAATCDRTATRLTTIEESISSSVRSIAWHGPDADSFRGKWNSGMKSQLTTVSERLTVVAKNLRAQAQAQRTASVGSGIAINAPRFETSEERALRELWEARAEHARRVAAAEKWA